MVNENTALSVLITSVSNVGFITVKQGVNTLIQTFMNTFEGPVLKQIKNYSIMNNTYLTAKIMTYSENIVFTQRWFFLIICSST